MSNTCSLPTDLSDVLSDIATMSTQIIIVKNMVNGLDADRKLLAVPSSGITDVSSTSFVNIINVTDKRLGGQSESGYFVAIIKKNDSAIASATTETLEIGEVKALCIPITVPLTHFKKGDILRLTIEGYAHRTDAGANSLTIAHDSQNRDGTIIIPSTDDTRTNLDFYCPFRVEL